MVRPRILEEEGVIITTYVPLSLAKALKETARANGVSVSEYIRMVLEKHIGEIKVADPDPPKRVVQPLRQLDLEEFDKKLKEFENIVTEIEKMKEKVSLRTLEDYQRKLKLALVKFDQLKKEAKKLKVDVERQSRLVKLYKKLRE